MPLQKNEAWRDAEHHSAGRIDESTPARHLDAAYCAGRVCCVRSRSTVWCQVTDQPVEDVVFCHARALER